MEVPPLGWCLFGRPRTVDTSDTRLVEQLLSREGNTDIRRGEYDPLLRVHLSQKHGCYEPKMVSVLQGKFLMESGETTLR